MSIRPPPIGHHARTLTTAIVLAAASDCTPPAPPHDDVVSRFDAAGTIDSGVSLDTRDPCDPAVYREPPQPRPAWDAEVDAPMPNIIPDLGTVQIQTRTFASTSCEVDEGCTVPGERRLLRFDVRAVNLGPARLFIGAPTDSNRPPGLFEFSSCHGHWHFQAFADYRLFDAAGTEVGRGHKQSFCIEDSFRFRGMGEPLCPQEAYDCRRQGLHPGWLDLYPRTNDCQYVDITGIPPGAYRLRVELNFAHVLAESRFDDNVAWLDVTIPDVGDGGVTPGLTDACENQTEGIARDCGWIEEGRRDCTPYATITLGCNPGCAPAIGTCEGNPMIRVCAGDSLCDHRHTIAENDDNCGTLCAAVSFRCPAAGRYTVMTGPHASGSASACPVTVR